MRPFGHTEAREEHEVLRVPYDNRLRGLWDELCQYDLNTNLVDLQDRYRRRMQALTPTVQELHALIMTTPHEYTSIGSRLGAFISLGYQLVPDETIVYDMHTPHLTLLGLRVLHKHIIIEGTVGRNTGMGLIGDLTVRGHTGIMTGRDMIGRLVVEGTMEEFAGQNMIGTITQRGKTEFKPISIPEERQVEFLWDIANPKKLCYDDLYRKLLKKYHRWSS